MHKIPVLTVSLVLAAAGHANAQPQPAEEVNLRANIRACAAIQEQTERLDCFDRLAESVDNPAANDRFVTIDRERLQEMQRDSFGFNLPSLSRLLPQFGSSSAPEIAAVDLQVERIIDRGDGFFSFVMTNGQRWTQTEPQRPRNLRAGDTVSIRRGALGSFVLTSSRGGAPHRVRREN